MSHPRARPHRRPAHPSARASALIALACAACARAEVRRRDVAITPARAAPSVVARTPPPLAPSATRALPDAAAPIASTGWIELAPGLRARTTRVEVDDAGPLVWTVVRMDLARVSPSARAVPGEQLASLASDPRVLVAVDAGFFDDAHRPAGTLIVRNATLAGPSPHGGSGVLVVREGRAEVLDAALPIAREPPVELAVQCGPRLIDPDGDAGIYRDDGTRFARTAACVRDEGRTLDLVVTFAPADPMRGPGLYAFARRLLAAPSPVGDARGCERALNLDGGPSTGIFVRGVPAATHDPIGPVPYALVVSAAR